MIAKQLLGELMVVLTKAFSRENAARLQIMQAAIYDIGAKLDALRRQSRALQQRAMTAELLEVVAGASAIVGGATGCQHSN